MRATNLQLADRIIGLFEKAGAVEMPTRVFRLTDTPVSTRGRPGNLWGQHPVIVTAAEEPVTIRTEDREPTILRVGDALLLSSGEFEQLSNGGSGSFIGFEALGTQPCRFFAGDASDPLGSRQCLEIFCTPFAHCLPDFWHACHELYCLLESAHRYSAKSGGAADPALCSMVRLAVIECLRAVRGFRDSMVRPMEKSNLARVSAAELFVSCNIDRDIRKSELAEHLGVSVSQLTLAFREVGQLAVRDRIRFRRVESARNLLADTGLSVSEVAERVGMNYRHFIRAFRQHAVLTPLRYRKISRIADKSEEVLKDFLHTENFDLVAPLQSPNGSSAEPTVGMVTVLISNVSKVPVIASRLGADGAFVDIGIISPERRLSVLDKPGQLWKIEPRKRDKKPSAGDPTFYQVAVQNSHFAFRG